MRAIAGIGRQLRATQRDHTKTSRSSPRIFEHVWQQSFCPTLDEVYENGAMNQCPAHSNKKTG
jgi:hypothetical protein